MAKKTIYNMKITRSTSI